MVTVPGPQSQRGPPALTGKANQEEKRRQQAKQSCPTLDDLRRQTWPSPVEAHRKLWRPVETLRQTAGFALLTGLNLAWTGMQKKKKNLHTGAQALIGLTESC